MREPPTRSGLHATRPNFCNGAIAVAETTRAEAEHFEAVSVTAIIVGSAAGVAKNVVSALIKKVLQNKKADVKVREVTSPDGSRTLIVITSAG